MGILRAKGTLLVRGLLGVRDLFVFEEYLGLGIRGTLGVLGISEKGGFYSARERKKQQWLRFPKLTAKFYLEESDKQNLR